MTRTHWIALSLLLLVGAGATTAPAVDLGSPYTGLPVFRTFGSFAAGCDSTAHVAVVAADSKLTDKNVGFDFPPFYRPTWREVLDHVARQMRCSWSFDAISQRFTFAPADVPPTFTLDLPTGWRREDRGLYVWHAPADQPFGLNVYDYGHYTLDPAHPELAGKLREHFALLDVSGWPHAPAVEQMSTVKVAGVDALYMRTPTPHAGGIWRQWSLILDGHALLIVSAMPADKEPQVAPAVDRMIATLRANARP